LLKNGDLPKFPFPPILSQRAVGGQTASKDLAFARIAGIAFCTFSHADEVLEMKRREFIAGLGGVAAWPLAAHAQQPALPVIGYLSSSFLATTRDLVAAFRRGLAEVGYIEDGNVAIEYRWAEDHYDRLPELAAELVRHQVAAIVVPGSTPGALVLKKATQTIPIVFLIGTDPVGTGLVASLSRPGGNLTGFRLLEQVPA
jgi:putative tryptophan/tyrosine transport system substrate-binding protein